MIRFATIGTSKITDKFLEAAKCCEEFQLQAVYSRSRDKAKAFAAKHAAGTYYDSLEELSEDSKVDAVYIASPNYMHCQQAITMMRAGKHVICEKSLGSNCKEVDLMFQTARENGVVLLEAVRSLHDPGYQVILENLNKLGMIRRAEFRFCQYSSRYDGFKRGERHNIFDVCCSAGSLMDIGVYCVEPLVMIFGKPESIQASSVMLRGKIDGTGTIVAQYQDMVGELIYSKITDSHLPSEIQGENGTMLISSIADPRTITIQYRDGKEETIQCGSWTNNMIFETDTFIRAIEKGDLLRQYEQISRESMRLMDLARSQCGIRFPADH